MVVWFAALLSEGTHRPTLCLPWLEAVVPLSALLPDGSR